MTARFVEVAVALPVDETFTYAIPEGMELVPGHAVLVPLGSRKVSGYVVALTDEAPPAEARPVARRLDPTPAFDRTQLAFLQWVARYYLAGQGEVIATALPPSFRRRTVRVHHATEAGIEALARGQVEEGPRAIVLREVIAHPGLTRRGLQRKLHGEVDEADIARALDALVRAALVEIREREMGGPKGQTTTVRLVGDPESEPRLGARMRGVVARLIEAGGELHLAELVAREGPGARSAVTRLEQRGLVRRRVREDRKVVAHGDGGDGSENPRPLLLNDEQSAALSAIVAAIDAGEPTPFLLHGVTGSGKTEIYLQAAATVLERGRQVLVLVPEIALTPQLTGRFKARFGDRVAVLHSGLGPGDRLREWRRIRADEARVAVGARSALFAPFRELGLIVVDEEHDDSYKQEEGVRYHARDLAVVRGQMAGCPVVLGSATPCLESWRNAREGRYRLLRLNRRATPRPMPRIELLDLRGRPPGDPLTPELLEVLREAIDAGGKAIVLYNRRGYAPVVECPGCGAHYTCPSCGVAMVLHRRCRRIECHYCGFHRAFQDDCPVCGTRLAVLGHGTERVEEALRAAFADVGIARMDADTTSTRGAHHRILESFRRGEVRLLVGTQLVAKGHDFPDVHVAAVVGVDHVLLMPDFRSAERTWSLVTQLAGRAGRGDTPGRVLVQTRHADHFVFHLLASEADPNEFYEREAHQRRVLRYPPFTRLVLVRVEGAERAAAFDRARELARALRARPDPAVQVLGPTAAPLARLVGRWRFQVVLRGLEVSAFRRWLARCRPILRAPPQSGVRIVVDVDPRNLM